MRPVLIITPYDVFLMIAGGLIAMALFVALILAAWARLTKH